MEYRKRLYDLIIETKIPTELPSAETLRRLPGRLSGASRAYKKRSRERRRHLGPHGDLETAEALRNYIQGRIKPVVPKTRSRTTVDPRPNPK